MNHSYNIHYKLYNVAVNFSYSEKLLRIVIKREMRHFQ